MAKLFVFLLFCLGAASGLAKDSIPPYLIGKWDIENELSSVDCFSIFADGRCAHYMGSSCDVLGWPETLQYSVETQTLTFSNFQLRYDAKSGLLRGKNRTWKRASVRVWNESFPPLPKSRVPRIKRRPETLPLMAR